MFCRRNLFYAFYSLLCVGALTSSVNAQYYAVLSINYNWSDVYNGPLTNHSETLAVTGSTAYEVQQNIIAASQHHFPRWIDFHQSNNVTVVTSGGIYAFRIRANTTVMYNLPFTITQDPAEYNAIVNPEPEFPEMPEDPPPGSIEGFYAFNPDLFEWVWIEKPTHIPANLPLDWESGEWVIYVDDDFAGYTYSSDITNPEKKPIWEKGPSPGYWMFAQPDDGFGLWIWQGDIWPGINDTIQFDPYAIHTPFTDMSEEGPYIHPNTPDLTQSGGGTSQYSSVTTVAGTYADAPEAIGHFVGVTSGDAAVINAISTLNRNQTLTAVSKAQRDSKTHDLLTDIKTALEPGEYSGVSQSDKDGAGALGASAQSATVAAFSDALSAYSIQNINPVITAVDPIFPSANIPTLGNINFDPYTFLPWLPTLFVFVRELIIWSSSLGFIFWFSNFLDRKVQSVLLAPQVSGSGGDVISSTAKQIATAALYTTVGVAAIAAMIALLNSHVSPIGIPSVLGNLNRFNLAGPASAGLGLVLKFTPIAHIVSLLVLQIVLIFTAIPIVSGVIGIMKLLKV